MYLCLQIHLEIRYLTTFNSNIMRYTHLLLLLTFTVNSYGSRILVVVPTPSLSHQIIFHPLNKELVKRGHEVTFITTNPAYPEGDGPENLTEIDLGPLSYEIWNNELTQLQFGKEYYIYKEVNAFFDRALKIFEAQIQTEAVQKVIKDKRFDLIMLEAWFQPALIWNHIYKVPTIKVSSLGMMFDNPETFGAPVHPLLYPGGISQRIYNLTIWEQFAELHKWYYVNSVFSDSERQEDAMLRRNFIDVVSLSNMRGNVDMLFLNIMSPMWNWNRPVPASVVYFGNVHQKPAKELPEDIKLFLDSSKNGAIYMSFGTGVPSSELPASLINTFVKVFSELEYVVLWKWDAETLPGQTDNIKISKWFPQSDIFRHPKLKLVITQGGLQTVEEAINNGKPLLGVPFLGDQWLNVENIEHLGLGRGLDFDIITEQHLKEAILDLIQNERYRNNVLWYRSVVLDQRMSALDRAVWWTEHVLRHGAEHVRAPAAGLHLHDYHEIELIILLLICCCIITLLLAFTARYVIKIVQNVFY